VVALTISLDAGPELITIVRALSAGGFDFHRDLASINVRIVLDKDDPF
jgi:hypothetical protein